LQRAGQDADTIVGRALGQSKAHLSPGELRTLVEGYMGTKPTAAQWSILVPDQRGEREALDSQRKGQERADSRIAMAIASSNKEKPRKLTAFDAANATPTSLVAARGDAAFEQTSVEQAINNRVGQLEEDLRNLQAQDLANAEAHRKLKLYTESQQGRFDKDALKKIIDREALGRSLVVRQNAIKADLALLQGETKTSGAAIGPNPRALIDEMKKTAESQKRPITDAQAIEYLKGKGVDLTQ
jgi:hypothetical protein